MYEVKVPVDLLKILTGTKLQRFNTILLPTKKNYDVRLMIPKSWLINDLFVTRGTRASRIYIISKTICTDVGTLSTSGSSHLLYLRHFYVKNCDKLQTSVNMTSSLGNCLFRLSGHKICPKINYVCQRNMSDNNE